MSRHTPEHPSHLLRSPVRSPLLGGTDINSKSMNNPTTMSHHCQTLDTEVRRKSRLSFTCSELSAEPSFISEESFVRAPLNSRIVSGTTAPRSKGKAREESLDTFPLDVQEALILEDLLFVLMVSDHRPSTLLSPDAMNRVSKEPISHTTKITLQKTTANSRAFDSRSQTD
jgi:hypothetical protein